MVTWLLASLALAGGVYLNGVPVDAGSLSGITLEKVDVKVDPQGNVYIVAPGYRVEVQPVPVSAGPGTGAFPPMPAAMPMAPPPPAYVPPAYVPPAPQVAAVAAAYPNGIARGRWWLVTSDEGSTGHTVEVTVNGQLVQTVKSGESQRIVDLGMFVRSGANTIECKAFSSQTNSGILNLYLGSGQDQQGTLKMDTPQVQFGVGTNTTYMNNRSYTLNVQ